MTSTPVVTTQLGLPRISQRTHLTGPERDGLRRKVAAACVHDKATIDAIALAIDRSYGTVHRLLSEADVRLRAGDLGRRHW